MPPILYAHLFSSYCWKVLIALWENDVAFDYRRIDDAAHAAAWRQASPTGKMPLLVDGAATVPEATIIVEHLHLHRRGPVPMLPDDPAAALRVRLLDRLSDNYLMPGMQTIVFDRLRAEADRDATGVAGARAVLDAAYGWWNGHMAAQEQAGRAWAADDFGLADCATAPALFYADWVHPISPDKAALRAYRARLLARPSVARAVDEARPFRSGFPFGDPGRD
ncbi:glutathione S-transferase family protein [Sphingomonas profundi]|uniref:glutathione S-transferase family protein n=1 Tax=Alterirhizorhabdus profundi TaxID=2681549 RepID=UPI0012E8DBB8|nr:glutathione S-transferase family protein [Sphingomonas profundi]